MFKRWVLTAWALENSGDWDCVDAMDIASSEVVTTMDGMTKKHGPPKLIFGYGGETVAFEWYDGTTTKIALKQKPCD